jgi:superfamily II DNA or RNA helicase
MTDKKDDNLSQWFNRLDEVISPTENVNITSNEEILYILTQEEQAGIPALFVEIILVTPLKRGGYSRIKKITGQLVPSNKAFNEQDTNIFYLLDYSRRLQKTYEFGNRYRLKAAQGVKVLQALMETSRCYWGSNQGRPLAMGKRREAQFVWQLIEDGTQRLQCRVSGANVIVLPLLPLWYVDIYESVCGPLNTDIDSTIASALINAPAIRPDQVKKFYEELQLRGIANKAPLPSDLKRVTHEMVHPPIPEITLFGESIHLPSPEYELNKHERVVQLPLIKLSFQYEKREVIFTPNAESDITYVDGDLLVVIKRNTTFEKQKWEQLLTLGLHPLASFANTEHLLKRNEYYLVIGDPAKRTDQLDFLMHQVPTLKENGWRVMIEPSFPLQLVTEIDEWYSEIEDKKVDQGWFHFELGIVIQGKRVNMLPLLLQVVERYFSGSTKLSLEEMPKDFPLLVTLPDGRHFPLELERVRGILSVLIELYDRDSLDGDEKLYLPRLRMGQLLDLENTLGKNTLFKWLGGEKLRNLGEKLRHFSGIENVKVPEGLNGILRHYQHDGLNWLQFLREYELAGILADDMGLGKTIQALAHMLIEKEQGRMDKPCLVVAPTSLMLNWQVEISRFAPSLSVLTLHGFARKKLFSEISSVDIVLTTYPLLNKDKNILLKHEYHLLILDEAQIIKNANAKSTRVVQEIQSRHRLCLSGTPMENHLGELWSLFNFLLPGLLGSSAEFRRLFRNPIEKENDVERRQSLAKRVAPFMLRRTKQEVVTELPLKSEMICNVELEGSQLDLYESIRAAMHHKVVEAVQSKGLSRSHIIILDALLKLRQACCDPRLLSLSAAAKVHESAKLNCLFDMLPNLIEEGRRVLLFSSFTSMLELIELELEKYKIDYVKLTGKTKDRATPITRFQAGKVPLFLISLKAGGIGLNLTAADTVIHYDPWWNPAAERQATDRAYRIGQDKPVFVYKLITKGTVEEKILAMQSKKQALLDGLFTEKMDTKTQLTAKDLEYLFEPL